MNLQDAARGVLVAHERVLEELARGASRENTPADLAVALVALRDACKVLERSMGVCCCGRSYEGHPFGACQAWHPFDLQHHSTVSGRHR